MDVHCMDVHCMDAHRCAWIRMERISPDDLVGQASSGKDSRSVSLVLAPAATDLSVCP